MVLTSAIMGAKIRTMWMTPFYLYIGTLFIYIFQNNINLNNLKVFNYIFIFLFLLSPTLYGYISISQENKRTDYKGKKISFEIQKIWDSKNKNKITHVIGDEWIAGNLSYHLKSRPIWIHNKDLNKIKIYENKINEKLEIKEKLLNTDVKIAVATLINIKK